MLRRDLQGLSIIEVLICLAIIAILSTISAPGFSRLSQKYQAEKVINELQRLISLTRASAVESGKIVTFCKSIDGQHCGGNWHQGGIVFTDQNADHQLNNDDQLLYSMPAFKLAGRVKFRAFQNKQYLQMTPLGFTNYQNGNFTYCPESNDASLAQQLVISRSGRTRYAIDSDGDGYRENSKGKPLTCP